jgi:outer membrane lipoprotein-sorting protein
MRWGVPVAVAAVVGAAVAAGPVIAAVQGDPSLPERTATQLLADAVRTVHTAGPPVMSGTVVATASLGLPALPLPSGMSSSPLALLSGSNTIKVWYGGGDRMRLALPGAMSETDLIVDGKGHAWLWQSEGNTATRFTLPKSMTHGGPSPAPSALVSALTPDALAAEALKAAQAGGTAVSVDRGQQVAGRAAYQLVLTPTQPTSLIKEIRLALDGEKFVPLRVQVYAKGTTEPAIEVGFTQVTFTAPAPENFAFTPPPGAKVEDKSIGDTPSGDGPWSKGAEGHGMPPTSAGKLRTFGSGWATVAEVPFSAASLAPPSGKGHGSSGGADPAKMLDTLLKSGKPVSGAFGSGRVIQTKLVSALITDDGRLLVGAVTPQALTEAAGQR